MVDNPLWSPDAIPGTRDNPLAQPPSWADAATQTGNAVNDWIAGQRAQSAQMGLWGPQGITPAGARQAGMQTAGALAMATTAPGPASPFEMLPAAGRRLPTDNYLTQLSDHAPVMFREAAAHEAAGILPGRDVPPAGGVEKYLADHPDLALGQGGNAGGVQLAFDASKLEGQINRSKPAWELGYQNGAGAEYVGKGTNADYQTALSGVRVPNSLDLTKGPGARVRFGLEGLQSKGWVRQELPNGYTEYLPPPKQ